MSHLHAKIFIIILLTNSTIQFYSLTSTFIYTQPYTQQPGCEAQVLMTIQTFSIMTVFDNSIHEELQSLYSLRLLRIPAPCLDSSRTSCRRRSFVIALTAVTPVMSIVVT